jgi:predicted ATPase
VRLTYVRAQNFRALEDVTLNLGEPISVIVGPNAIGKTTVLQAIRLARSILAPRTGAETQQVLMSLNALPQGSVQAILPEAIARDTNKPILIDTTYSITDSELATLAHSVPRLATTVVQAQFGQAFAGPTNAASLFSSPMGQEALREITARLDNTLATIRETKQCRVNLVIDIAAGRISGVHDVEQVFIQFLEQSQPPYKTLFSYFPADRALPAVEPPFALGQGDVNAQLETYNSQPQTKYNRLRNAVFAAHLRNEPLNDEFEKIFRRLLSGRRFKNLGLNQQGTLAITIEDIAAKHDFDIDSMSSGEKGLILTFLIIAQTMAQGGILLLDEPELHLNPAATRKLLSFLAEEYVHPHDLQAIICSHSPEILADGFERADCTLYRIKSPHIIERLRKRDFNEVNDALQALGTSTVDSLLYDADLFVEGPDDVRILQVGFSDLLSRINCRGLGGRAEVEKQIQLLQEEERKGRLDHAIYFLFDHDNRASTLSSSDKVRVMQWRKYCIENYLLDFEVIKDALREPEIADASARLSAAELERLFRGFADQQLLENVARTIYDSYGFEGPGFRVTDSRGKNMDQIADALLNRLSAVKSQVSVIEPTSWRQQFLGALNTRLAGLRTEWDSNWMTLASGKRLFEDFRQKVQLRRPIDKVKLRIMERMRAERSVLWRSTERELREHLASDPPADL